MDHGTGQASGRRSATGRRETAILLLRIVLVAGAYYLAARLGLRLASENRNVTAVWPPTGIAVAALVMWGLRVWPGIGIGALIGNLANAAGAQTAAAITIGNTIAPVLAAYVMTRFFRLQPTLDRVRDVLALVVGAFGAMTLSASGGTVALALTDAIGQATVRSVWLVWWVGDAIGVVVFAPFLLVLPLLRRMAADVRRILEAIALLAITAATTYFVFNTRFPVAYLVFVPLVWAALRFEQVGAASVTVVVTLVALASTVAGLGPFSSMSPTDNLLSLQIFNASVGTMSLVLAAAMHQRTRAEQALRSSEERYRKLFEEARDFVCIHNAEGNITYVNASAERITGYARERLVAMNIADLVAPEHLGVVRRTSERQLVGDTDATTYEVDVVGTSGRRVSLELSTTVVHENGAAIGIQSIGRDITSRKLAEDRLRQQALYDETTGLPNRTLLRERLEHGLSLARREGTELALVVIDLDQFKKVNDAYDHRAGDAVLAQFGARLKEIFPEPDTVARSGGDEFAVVLPSLSRDRPASVIGEQIRAELEAPFTVSDGTVQLSASVGIAVFPQHADDASTITQRADFALFASKRAGGNRYSMYEPGHDSQGARRLALLDELHAAIEGDGLLLNYQPKIEIATMRTVGVECLLRWVHPRLGLVPPVEFIPLAEASDMIGPITLWVFREALRRCALWLDAGLDLTVAVNLSRTDLRDGKLVDHLQDLLIDTGVAPERLVLEVSESNVADEALHPVLKKLGVIGVPLSVDEFGTSSTSMVNLRRLPIREIKLDRSFVRGITTNREDDEIARSIIELGHNIGVPVVAEGVETRETWNRLVALGCDQAQGYLICRPVSAPEFESWLHTPAWTGRVR